MRDRDRHRETETYKEKFDTYKWTLLQPTESI